MIDIEIATTWNVETLYYVFNGVAAIMAGGEFAGLLKLVFLFAVMIGIFAFAGNKQLEMAQWFVQALVFTTVLNMPIARVAITDRAGIEPPRVVDHVPFALAVVGQTANLVGGWLTRTYETVFGVPDALALQQGDLAFGHRILRNVNKAVIRDPELRSDLMQFIKECTLYDLKDGAITANQIVGETDTWNTIFNNTSPARYVTYHSLSPAPTTGPCTDAALYLKAKVEAGMDAAQAFYGRQNFSRADSDATASAMFATAIGASYSWVLDSAASASEAMRQAMFNNLWREAGNELPALMSDTARIQELQSLQGAAQAARQNDGANATISMLAQETLPHMRNWLEALLYGLFPVVVVLVVVAPQDGVKHTIGGYMMLLAWIALWPLLFALINHLSLVLLRHKLAALKLSGGIPFQLSDVFDATLGDELAAIGYMVILVPFMAAMIIKMGQGGFMFVADKIAANLHGTAAAVGGGLAAGNDSIGQLGIDTASVNSTAMHKYDSNVGLFSGGAGFGFGNGDTAVLAANGAQSLTQFQNRLLTSMNVSKSYQSDRAQEAHQSTITSTGDQEAVRHGDASTFTDVVGYDRTRGDFQNNTVSAGYTRSGQQAGMHGKGEELGRQFADRSQFSTGVGANDSLYAGASVGIVTGGTGQASGAGGNPVNAGGPSGGRSNPLEEKRIAEGMRQGGASQSQIDSALATYRNGGGVVHGTRPVTDDFGNQVNVPTSQHVPAGSGPAAGQAGAAAGRGSARAPGAGLLGALVSGNIGGQSQKTYSAQHGRERSDGDNHAINENARIETGFAISGQQGVNMAGGGQSAQSSRDARDAARTDVDEYSRVRDVSDRKERGIGNRSSRSESDSLALQQDLLSDPSLLEKVAARNGMSAIRFMGQARGQMLQMVRDYTAEKHIAARARALQSSGLDGSSLAVSQAELAAGSAKDRSRLPRNIDALHKAKAAKTGFAGTAPVKVDLGLPPIVQAAQDVVRSQLDPASKGSIPDRAAALDENAAAWASHDKAPGEGRANPLSVVETAEKRDLLDSGKKVLDRLKRGDGSADGEKLNDNVRRETGSRVQIERPGKKD